MPLNVLLVDDDPEFRKRFEFMAGEHFRTTVADGYDEGIRRVRLGGFDAVLLDVDFREARTGLDLLREIRDMDSDLPVIMLTGDDRVETINAALRLGADGYTRKHVNLMVLQAQVEHALDNALWRRHARSCQVSSDELIGTSDPIENLRREIREVARTSLRVLIRGESGVGKEIVAQAIHAASQRASGRFVTVNSAVGTDELFDDMLFGHVRGAYTGADRPRVGRIELARGGTLYLDEIGKMSLTRQAKLLRVVEDERYERIGDEESRRTDIRLVSASNEDLEARIETGELYGDFYYRLREYEITVPPLRHRLEDLGAIARFLIDRFCDREGLPRVEFEPAALDVCRGYDWPGNVRELDAVLKRAVVAGGVILGADGVAAALDRSRLGCRRQDDRRRTLDEARRIWEAGYIAEALARHGGSTAAAMEELGMKRSTLYEKIQQYGLRTGKRDRTVTGE